jgi:hypothetical protein
MAISFKCPGCGASYNVKDEYAGKSTKCKKCGELMKIPAAKAADFDDLPDLSSLAPPAASDWGSPEPVMPAPRHLQAEPATVTPAAATKPKKVKEPRAPGAGLGTLRAPDSIAMLISIVLMVALVLIVSYTMYGAGLRTAKGLPDPLQSRVWVMLVLMLISTLAQHVILIGGITMLCLVTAAAISQKQLKEGSIVRVVGAMACPTIALMLVITWLGDSRQSDAALWFLGAAALGLLVSVFLLQALLHLDWKTTGIGAAFIVPSLMVALYSVGRFVHPRMQTVIQGIAGMDADSVQKWAREHPEEIAAWRQRQWEQIQADEERAKQKQLEIARMDPLFEKDAPYKARIDSARSSMSALPREEAEPIAAALMKEITAIKPEAESPRWKALVSSAESVEHYAKGAPSKVPPPELFIPPSQAEALGAVPTTVLADLTPPMRFSEWTIQVPKAMPLDLGTFDQRDRTIKWEVPPKLPSISLTIRPVTNEQQRRPYATPDERYRMVARQNDLFAIGDDERAPTKAFLVNGQPVFQVFEKRNRLPIESQVYVARGDKNWLVIRVELPPGNGPPSAQREALLMSFRTLLHVPNGKNGIDPFSLDAMIRRLDHEDAARSVVKRFGDAAIPALETLAASGGPGAARGQSLLDEWRPKPKPETPAVAAPPPAEPTPAVTERPVPKPPQERPKPKPIDLQATLKDLADSSSFGRRRALEALAKAEVDSAAREEVAKLLEQIALSKDGYMAGEEVAAALIVWQRPQSPAILMPLLADEKLHPWMQKPMIKFFGSTKERKYVYPILRWIQQQPDTVVDVVKQMGPIAEDDTIKLLLEKNNDARKNAAKILSEIGTKKSLAGLLRAANDPRDAGAATMARAAHEAVKARVDAAAATQPASGATPEAGEVK